MKAPSRNPQCGQMDIKSSMTMAKSPSSFQIKVLEGQIDHRSNPEQ
jgi:hypothetical protein